MQEFERLARSPHTSFIEPFIDLREEAGWPDDPEKGKEPVFDPAKLRWTMCLALTVGDYYYLLAYDTSHKHDWYPAYDEKIGLPLGPGERVKENVWRRAYEKALVVVNLPGAAEPYEVKLQRTARDSFTGETGTGFVIPPGDGRILLTGSKADRG